MLLIHFILIVVFIGWWLGTIEVPAGFSGLTATGAVRKRYMGLIIITFFLVGACLFSESANEAFIQKNIFSNSVSSVIIALAASIAVLTTYKLSQYSSICYGVMGAIIGWNIFTTETVDYVSTIRLVLSWILVPVLSGAVAAALYAVYRFFIRRSGIHILLLTKYLQVSLLLVAIIFSISAGMNHGTLLLSLIDSISPGFDFSWNGWEIKEKYILLIISVLIIGILTWRKATSKIQTMAEGEFDISPESVLVTFVSGIIVLTFFSLPSIAHSVGLIATPISISGIIIGGLAGINIVRKGNKTSYQEEYRMLISVLATPVVSFLVTYFILITIDTESLFAISNKSIAQSRGIINLTPILTTTLFLLFATFIIVYLRKQRRIRIQAEIILLENQNKLFDNQKAMSALEVKTVITENEHLNSRLELRRKELINIALGITEQKNFQESLYLEVKQLKEEKDPDKLRNGIDNLEKQLLQKINFSQELESFYSQIESLHKDFNMRLTERYPNLTDQERRLTTLLRLGFSSKHIAALMNISPKSVEMSRYRLRNRLGLEHDQKLINFIKNI
ncbi:inorganic phosphate transporter [Bacteroides sp. OttesenSCG-928-D19]|nr:inorganic phosphate transporter [Bacteroides sp. OttesenSCG-928-N06]MDL2304798.1 inorganic phosphate transporter [Bacteroides sp. OttesenSCG-928-D19]